MRRRLMGEHKLYDAEIEYLEGDGNAYIDTGFHPNSTMEFEIAVSMLKNEDGTLFGMWTNYYDDVSLFINKGYFTMYNSSSSRITKLSTPTIGKKNIVQLKDNSIYIDGVYNDKVYIVRTSGRNVLSLVIFGQNRKEEVISYNNIGKRIHYFKIWDEGNLLFDFIPVVKNGVGYMYDKVSGKLFGNNGTGKFIVGPRILSGGVDSKWLTFNILLVCLGCSSAERRAA